MINTSLGKTKKIKKGRANQQLWNLFSSEIPDETAQPLECVYRSSGEREHCDLCKSSLAITEEGFLILISWLKPASFHATPFLCMCIAK